MSDATATTTTLSTPSMASAPATSTTTAAIDTGSTGHGWLVVLGVFAIVCILIFFTGRSLLTCCGCIRRRDSPKLATTKSSSQQDHDKEAQLPRQGHWADFDPFYGRRPGDNNTNPFERSCCDSCAHGHQHVTKPLAARVA